LIEGSELFTLGTNIFLAVYDLKQELISEGVRLGLVGWVKNTYGGTVVGQVQGPRDMVEEMKVWLSKEGSPSSRITRASFTNQRTIDKLELSGFKTRF
uniref:Acylphosphatase 2 n=1 Tax=Sphaeramia orbicularis TaxID=375764 RepID=A0A673BMJ8_9TELE